MRDTTLIFDIETHSASRMWELSPHDMFRLGGYAWGDGPVTVTDDLDEFRATLLMADKVIGHNVHQFDLSVVFGKGSLEPFRMALDGRVFDTFADLPIIDPYPHAYTNRYGERKFIRGVGDAMAYYGLAEAAYRWGTTTKIMDLADLAFEYGDPDLRGRARTNDGYGKIPVDDERFVEYLKGDVIASRELAAAMLKAHPWTPYRAREQRLHGILAQCTRNGIHVDEQAAHDRLRILNERKDKHLKILQERYGMPTEGKQPLRTKPGKAAVFAALEEVGIYPDDLPRTKTGNPSLGGKEVMATVEERIKRDPDHPHNDEAESLAQSLAAISGARMTAETLLKYRQTDGYIHPSITALQRSARFSFRDPGLTVVGSRGEGKNDKAILASRPGHLFVEFDFQAADTRAVCAYSGDADFKRDYVDGDAHTRTAQLIWPGDPLLPNNKHPRRQEAKVVTHGSAYRIGARTLSASAGLIVREAQAYLQNLARAYPRRTRWQERTTKQGERGYVVNAWGRRLPVEKDRAFTQSTAQLGQNATREMGVDLLLRLPREVSRWLVGLIHDAFLFDWPADKVEEYTQIVLAAAAPLDIEAIARSMGVTPPSGTLVVEFPLSAGPPGRNWLEADHG